MTVLENLRLGATALRGRPASYSLERIFELFPILSERQRQLAGSLSGGQQQMLAIGRALMGSPRLLLLDEPSEGLAPIMVQKIGDLIQSLREMGKTIVLAEQNLHFCLGLADRAVVIDKGTDVFVGTISELNDNTDIKQRYLSV
jgi:branched-chain amino acid transport system ATP-binding protein